MAEAAGLVVGAVSLATLFSTCVELAEYIHLAQNLGREYEESYTKFLLLKLRLQAWGRSMKIGDQDVDDQFLQQLDEPERLAVGRSLVAIKGLLLTVRTLQFRYSGGSAPDEVSTALMTRHPPSADFQEIETQLATASCHRQKRASLRSKVVWAIRDKKAFEELIADLRLYVDELNHVAQRISATNDQPPSIERSRTASSNDNLSLKAVANEGLPAAMKDGSSQELITRSISSLGHSYVGNKITERAKVLQGDIGDFGQPGARHCYEGNEISGEAKIIQGNMSGMAWKEFWE